MHLFTKNKKEKKKKKKESILKLQSQIAQCQGGGAHGFNYPMDGSIPQRKNVELSVPVCNSQGEALDSMNEGVISFPTTEYSRATPGLMPVGSGLTQLVHIRNKMTEFKWAP